MKLSGCILVKNNAKSIGYAVESLHKYVDELVIIDSGSTDGTIDIVKKYTDKIIFNEFKNFADQRNFGITQCQGEWVFMLDADEVVGPNFPLIRNYLDGRYRSIALPRYNIINLNPVTYMITKPHYLNWQTRCFRNDKKSYFWDKVHHKLGNYRPRLKCAVAHYFHLDFLFNSYATRKAKVDYYNSIEPGSGYPEAYLFEDFPYQTATIIEQLDPKLLSMLRQDTTLLQYPVNECSKSVQAYEEFLYHLRGFVTRLRTKIQI